MYALEKIQCILFMTNISIDALVPVGGRASTEGELLLCRKRSIVVNMLTIGKSEGKNPSMCCWTSLFSHRLGIVLDQAMLLSCNVVCREIWDLAILWLAWCKGSQDLLNRIKFFLAGEAVLRFVFQLYFLAVCLEFSSICFRRIFYTLTFLSTFYQLAECISIHKAIFFENLPFESLFSRFKTVQLTFSATEIHSCVMSIEVV